MKWLDRIAGKFGYSRPRPMRRNYAGAATGRLTSDWTTSSLSSDAEIRTSLRTLRARSRNETVNNDYARKFIKMTSINVVGPKGITLQNKARDPNGQLDKAANVAIEAAWSVWGKKENASVTGKHSWLDVQRMVIEAVARDGEILARKVRGADNPFGFSIQMMEGDYLDETYDRSDVGGGNEVRMGVEMNRWGKAIAYHLKTRHPGDASYLWAGNRYERVPADEIIHVYISDRSSQSRGVPWMHSALTRLRMLGAYEEAELVAARIGASKMGFFTSPAGDGYVGDDTDDKGNLITEAEPGSFEQLPKGVEFSSFNPEHPVGNFAPFMKTMLRGIASGLIVSYNSLAADLEGVNYSSLRAGVIEERDAWRMIQRWLIEHFHQEVFDAWLDMALLSGAVPLPYRKIDKFSAATWHPRGWDWVDPVKDVESDQKAINFGLKTRSMTAAEKGYDLEEVFAELKTEQDLAKQYGLTFETSKSGAGKGTVADATQNN